MLTATTGHVHNQHLSNSNDKVTSKGNQATAAGAITACVAVVKPRSKPNARALEDLRNLKIKVQTTERQLVSVLSRPSVRETFADFVAKEKNGPSGFDLEKEQKHLSAELGCLRNVLERLKSHISKSGEEGTYLSTLKLLMETLETNIVAFKQRQRERQVELQTEERQICNELQGWESRFASWDKIKTGSYEKIKEEKTGDHKKQSGAAKIAKADTMSAVDGLLPDVVRFQNYITAHGGRYGTWDDLSHAGFVRTYQKHKDAPSEKLVGILRNSFPGADVEEHLRWYETFCFLENEQKKAIRRWKQGRIQRSLMTADATSSAHPSNAKNDRQRTEKEQTVDPQREGEEEEKEREREREREMKRKKLSLWKEHRKLQELERKDREDRERRLQEEQERKAKNERQEYLKARLSEHAKRKEQEEEEENRRREDENQLSEKSVPLQDPKLEAKKAKERDMKIALRRREDVLAKQKSATERQRRMELLKERNPSSHVATRDPSRLLKPTTGILLRRKALAEENSVEGEKGRGMAYGATVLPRRHMPSWRKGV